MFPFEFEFCLSDNKQSLTAATDVGENTNIG
jgi:hypothetical protein